MKERNPNSERKYGVVTAVRVKDGNVWIDARDTETPAKIYTDVYMERGAPGQVHVPQTGWVVSVTPDIKGEYVATGIVSGPEARSSRGADLGYTSPSSNDQFDQGILPEGTYIRQFDRGTGIHAKPGQSGYDLELHALNNLTVRVGGTLDFEQGVPAPGEKGVTDGTHNGGTPLKVVTQQEWDDLTAQVNSLENLSYGTEAGRTSYAYSTSLDHVFENTDMSGPADTSRSVDTTEVVDAVTDLGWDNTGATAVPMSTDAVDNRTIEVPAGTYLINQNHSFSNLNNFKLIGKGATRGDVVFTTGDGNPAYQMLDINGGGDIELGMFTLHLDDTTSGAGPVIHYLASGDFYFHDIEYTGFDPGTAFEMNVAIKDPNGVGIVADVKKAGPSDIEGHGVRDNIGIVDSNHKGTIYFRRTHVENDPGDAPWYTSGHGTCHFQNCYHANNSMAQFRIGGNSTLKDCTAVVDLVNSHVSNTGLYSGSGDIGSTGGCSGVLLAGQTGKKHGGRIENCTFQMIDNTDLDGTTSVPGQAIRFHGTANATVVKDVIIQADTDTQAAVYMYGPGEGYGNYNPPSPHYLVFENIDITGTAVMDSVFRAKDRPGCRLKAGCIDLPNTSVVFDDLGTTSWDVQEYNTTGCRTPS